MTVPRAEYPRPQFIRPDWLCLNGEWQFEIDHGDSGLERGLCERDLARRILVPFCPESPLSGVGYTDFMSAVWYRRQVTIPSEWIGRNVLLHFQAIDYDATIWVNGVEVRRHRGGFTPITCDLRGVASPGDTITIVVRARDNHTLPQPRGKQSQRYENYSCFYTRTTGIWQTVWLEPIPECALKRPRLTPDVANGVIHLQQPLSATRPGLRLRATLGDADGPIGTFECAADQDFAPQLALSIPSERRRLWSPQDPHLYNIVIELVDASGNRVDKATTYAGLRGVTIEGKAIKINGQPLFQRLVLDQGFYPDGILTAPSDQALENDIKLSQAAGFNGARLHQKVFEERFLYHADRLGYLVWAEFPDWGCRGYGPADDHQQPTIAYAAQWLEEVERDYSHPCIIGWCPFNETAQPITDRITVLDDAERALFLAAKAMDATRPVLDASGYAHRVPESDVYDCHDYDQNVESFTARHAGVADGKPYYNGPQDKPWSLPYAGQPFFVSEFGGTWWNPQAIHDKDRSSSWGYGNAPTNLDEFYQRFEGLCSALLGNPAMFGYCYTQLTDVYQEQNGIYTFDRKAKFDLQRLRSIQMRQAAIEKMA